MAWKKSISLLLIFTIIAIVYVWTVKKSNQTTQQKLLEQQTDKFRYSYQAVKMSFMNTADVFIRQLVQKSEIIELYAQIPTASEARKDSIRNQIYYKLTPGYEYLKTKGIRQLHFHEPNNISFLRFHRPHKYGDNLTNIRYSVKMANETHRIYYGFEEGRIFNGFRNVFPLYQGAQHIGSVEASFSFDVLRKQLERQGFLYSGFMIKKDIVESKVFESELGSYIPSLLSDDYMHEIDFLHYNFSQADFLKQIDNRLKNKIANKLKQGQSFTISCYFNNQWYLITFLSIKNVEGLPAAYMFAYQQNSIINKINNRSIAMEIIGIVLIIVVAVFTVVITQNNAKVKEINTKLSLNENKYRTVANFNYDWEYWLNTDDEFVYVSPSCKRITGYLPDDFYADSKLMYKIIHPDDKLLFLNHKHEINEEGERNFINFRIITKSNQIEWIGHQCLNVYDEKGNYQGIRGSNRQITEQKQIQDDFRELSIHNNSIVEKAPIGIVTYNAEGQCVSANPASAKILGVSVDYLLSQNYNHLPNWKAIGLFDLVQQAKNNNKCYTHDFNTFEITPLWLSLTVVPLAGSKADIMILFENISAQKESNRRLKEAIATKDKFFNIIAHDLRSPFNGMLGILSMMLNSKIDAERSQKLLKALYQSAHKTYSMLNDLLDWARAQSGTIQLLPSHLFLAQVVEALLTDVNEAAQAKQITIETSVAPEQMVYADKEMLKTIIRNLLTNALKFTARGGSVTITAQQLPTIVEISVADTGVGMTAEKAGKLFDITEKNSTEGTENEKGTGLGLLLCKEFIELHRGQIHVESTLGKGSIFRVSFPIES